MNLLDSLFIKRFCLPCDTNLETFNPSDCLGVGNYNHIACVLKGQDPQTIHT
jgi:hypothetical protein